MGRTAEWRGYPQKNMATHLESGKPNPRWVAEQKEKKEELDRQRDLRHTFRRLTKAEVKQQYDQNAITELLLRAQQNLKNMSGPTLDGPQPKIIDHRRIGR